MKKITCDYCFEDNFFDEGTPPPENCKNCNSPIAHLPVADTAEKSADTKFSSAKPFGLSDGIVLTYQKTGDLIEIPHNEIIILGRQNAGSDVLANIPQISREHCKIEFLNGRYLVTDLNSLNGTFIGSSKRDCLKHQKQELKDNEVLYLGREPFLVNINTDLSEQKEGIPSTEAAEDLHTPRYKCKGCGKIHDMNLIICDECGSYGQIELLED